MANSNLNAAKEAKKDEFYTQLEDINNELCDDPRVSNFFTYFAYNFEFLGLKRLITTCYKNQDADLFSQHQSEKAVYLIYEGDKNGNNIPDPEEIGIHPLKGDGDFRSRECVELLKEADIVVTNPPFSLFREYVAQLMEYQKEFIIIGSLNAIHYKEIFPLIKQNRMWLGYGFAKGNAFFKIPAESKREYASGVFDEVTGLVKFRNCTWFTNIDHKKRHELLILYKHYTPEEYPKYDNFDAIEVSKIDEIPVDYNGAMGVPDTILDQLNPDQFEIIGLGSGDLAKQAGVTKNYRGRTDLAYTIDGKHKCPYSRILIRKIQK